MSDKNTSPFRVTNQDVLVENLEQQLAEVEMLEAMFSNPGEFVLDEPLAISDCQRWRLAASANRVDFVPPVISFSIRLSVGAKGDPFQIFVTLPHDYPSSEKPEFYVTSEKLLNRENHRTFNKDLATYIDEHVVVGEVTTYQVVSWLQENVESYVTMVTAEGNEKKQGQEEETKNKLKESENSKAFARYWIYSHHIYSKIKRRDILDLSKEYQLTGFSMPGKPGIICMEGSVRNVSEAWGIIKSWNWKKINVKYHESEPDGMEDARRYTSFEEIGFVKSSDTRDYHMDMGEFHKYLESHGCGYMFKELFGV